MAQSPLAQSADKAVLFARLGLTEQVHRLLLQEASSGRDRLSRDPANLTEQSARAGLTQPYKWDELSETAKHREILYIAENSGVYTKAYYVAGSYRTNVNEENWVARWYLWHSFRYRDNKDARSRSTATTSAPAQQGTGAPYYDPVHGTYR
ncbi:hypothetical protein BS50DRAFT_578714 [Corynespora cassiicola Philippines]|uniref:Uncharacterized protein n=1 Tax=Corynespora cassiicola Philippines TaxID=1448308 RepID=A0A2T2N641_CORCC|nr:hypothetical protein BS50DRAFT_578714 [Corynespora cassiicola Philippines]